jgi:hypothetical protein
MFCRAIGGRFKRFSQSIAVQPKASKLAIEAANGREGRICPPSLLMNFTCYGSAVKRSLKSFARAAFPSSGLTPKISSSVRNRELCV